MQIIPLLEACNQSCLFCSALGRNETFSYEHNLAALEKAIDLGSKQIAFSGGETTLCPDLFKLIKYVVKHGVKIELQTNGLTSANLPIARALVLSGISLFNINFPSHKPLVNDILTRVKGSLPRRVLGVNNLLSLGAKIRLTHIICSHNYKDLPDFAKFACEQFSGIKLIQFSFLKAMGGVHNMPELLPHYDEVCEYLQEALYICQKHKIKAVTDHIPPCFLGNFYYKSVDYIKTGENEDTTYSEREKKLCPECIDCLLNKRCFGPRKDYIEIKGNVNLKPIKFLPK